ncbi:MAG: glycosyltransferase family 4 protein [Pseudomonadota bacterium]
MKPLKVFLHDYAGHPFQAELSRALAARGHVVTHAFFAGDPGPKGDLKAKPGDAASLSFAPIDIGVPYTKGDFIRRRFLDLRYGKAAAAAIEREKPDIVFSGNTPTEAQEAIVRAANRVGAKFVYWCQDYYSVAVSKLLTKKLGAVGALVGGYYTALERRQMRASAAIIMITSDFAPLARSWGVTADRLHVVPNWGPIDSIPVLPKDNAWAREHDLADKMVYLYSGTIGFKHNPELLVALAEKYRANPKVRVVVTAGGVAHKHLEERKKELKLDNLLLLGLQPFDRFAEVLASGDVLTAVIEHDAGAFSVPSKMLSYLCAARPILLAAPAENLAAKILREINAGAVVDPDDQAGFLAAADLIANGERSETMAAAARAYAEENFDISRVTNRIEAIFAETIGVGAKPAN